MTNPVTRAGPRPGVVLVMLLLVYSFNFLDRQILGILAGLIRADLKLTDTRLGMLGGVPFAILYSTMGVPLALLADRTSRSRVIASALIMWSGFTALCGAATGFWVLFACRLGVGAGEAGGVAPSHALIGAYFAPRRRARALAIYSLGIPLGSAAGVLLGAYIAHHVSWRAAFTTVGLAGIAIAPLFLWLVKEPPRPIADQAPAPIGAVFAIIAHKPSFWLMAAAAAISSMSGYGLAFWVPQVIARSYGFGLAATSYFFGSLLLLGGTLGVFMGGVLADRLGGRDRGVYARLPAIAWGITAPLFIAGFLAPSPVVAWLLFFIPNALNILWLGPLATAVQHLVPTRMRASAAASFLLIVNLVGIGLGSWLMGRLSDMMTPRFGTEALRYSAVVLSCFYLVAMVLAFAAVKPLRRDWVEEPGGSPTT